MRWPDLRDVLALGGLALMASGAAVLHVSAGMIVLGLGLFYLGVWHGSAD